VPLALAVRGCCRGAAFSPVPGLAAL